MKKLLFTGFMLVAVFMIESCGPSELTVSTRPDPPFYTRPIAPGPDYIWIDGDWRIRNHQYIWSEGHWARPGGRVWVGGSWESRGGGWGWRRGHWK